jgi:hypothetical protein
MSLAGAAIGVAATQSIERGPDGTPLACNFNLRLQGGEDPTGISTTCDTYGFNLFKHPLSVERSTFAVSEDARSKPLTYHVADMPLNAPVLLLKADETATRVIARRRADRIDFLVGRVPFKGPPPNSLLPH